MNMSKIFKQAHAETKALVTNTNFDYRATFALVLKQIIATNSQEKTFPEKLLEVGGKLWENYGKKRIYLTATQINEISTSRLAYGDNNNRFYYDYESNKLMRRYKGGRPKVLNIELSI